MADNKKMMKVYTVMWAVVAVVYGLWMSFVMSWDQYAYIIPTKADMLLPAEQFIAKFDGMLYEPMYANATIYWLWVIGSTILLFFYAFFIKKILFAEKLTKPTTIFCIANLIAGFAFITWYGFLSFPEQFGNILTDVTASMLRIFIKKACGTSLLFKPRIVICIPSGVTEVERRAVREASIAAGADFVKTSTGFGKGGATVHAVKLMADTVHPHGPKVKASGGIHNTAEALAMMEAGADRIGASCGVEICK